MAAVIKRDLLILLRDKGSLFFLILFPSLLVFILGTMLAGIDVTDRTISPIHLNVKLETTDSGALLAVDSLMNTLVSRKQVVMTETVNEETVVVTFTDPFAISVKKSNDPIQNRAIDLILRSFSMQYAALSSLSSQVPSDDLKALAFVEQVDPGYARSMIDYYAVASCIMILVMSGSMSGAEALFTARRDGTIARMMSTPKSRVSLYIATVIASAPQFILSALSLMITSTFVFGAKYGEHFLDNVLLFFMFFMVGLTVQALSALIGLFINVKPMMVIMPITWALLFFSGSFAHPIYIKGITEYLPPFMIQNAAFELTVFGSGEKCVLVLAICSLILIISTAIGAVLFNRKGVVIK
jgi:ABC-2 type transport system permease protein